MVTKEGEQGKRKIILGNSEKIDDDNMGVREKSKR